MEESTAERVGEVGDDDPVRALRAWLRDDVHPEPGNLELLRDPDTLTLAGTFRACVAADCLKPDEVSGVSDLIAHAIRVHGTERMGDVTERGFRALAAWLHGCDANGDIPEPVMLPGMVPQTDPPIWAVDRCTGWMGRVLGWMTQQWYPCERASGWVFSLLPVVAYPGYSGATICENNEVTVFEDRESAEDYSAEARAKCRVKLQERRAQREQRAAEGAE